MLPRCLQGQQLPFSWYIQEGEPAPVNACWWTILKRHGVHNKGVWAFECPCPSAGLRHGDRGPLLRVLMAASPGGAIRLTRERLAEELSNWWAVPGGAELLTTAAKVRAAGHRCQGACHRLAGHAGGGKQGAQEKIERALRAAGNMPAACHWRCRPHRHQPWP